jgi:hypothetical protein
MSEDAKPQRAPGKSKTELRRGQLTPGLGRPKKALPPRGAAPTSREEEAMLFGELPDDSISQ